MASSLTPSSTHPQPLANALGSPSLGTTLPRRRTQSASQLLSPDHEVTIDFRSTIASRTASQRETSSTLPDDNAAPVSSQTTSTQSEDRTEAAPGAPTADNSLTTFQDEAGITSLARQALDILRLAAGRKWSLRKAEQQRLGGLLVAIEARSRAPPPTSQEARLERLEALVESIHDKVARPPTQHPCGQAAAPRPYAAVVGRPAHRQARTPPRATSPSHSQTAPLPKPTRATLRVSQLPEDHSLRSMPVRDIFKRVSPHLRSISVGATSAYRLRSGDIAITLQSESDVEKVFEASDEWIHQSFSDIEPVPALAKPGAIHGRSLVIHGVSTDEDEELVFNDITESYGVSVQSVRWLLGEGRRKQLSHSMMVIELSSQDECEALMRHRSLTVQGRSWSTAPYRPRPRIDQCAWCQGFGHRASQCTVTPPVCRICAKSHETRRHPRCKDCPGNKPPAQHDGCPYSNRACVNCGAAREASHRDCPTRQEQEQETAAISRRW